MGCESTINHVSSASHTQAETTFCRSFYSSRTMIAPIHSDLNFCKALHQKSCCLLAPHKNTCCLAYDSYGKWYWALVHLQVGVQPAAGDGCFNPSTALLTSSLCTTSLKVIKVKAEADKLCTLSLHSLNWQTKYNF